MRDKLLTLLMVCVAAPAMLQADVADQAANGFTIKYTTVIRAAPEEVYNKLVHNIGDWWSSAHTFSNDSHHLSIDDKVMGCFCETLPGGGGVRHAEVIMVMPNKMLVMTGSFGPLQKFGATGTLTIVLQPLNKDTRVQLMYAVGGYLPDGLNTWAAPVDKVWIQQVTRLKSYVETGNPAGAGASEKQP
jgi:uncharacterized protein YndB with AHSA1/START domain